MTGKPSTARYTPKCAAQCRERSVRLFRVQRPNYPSENAAYVAIASKLGCSADTCGHGACRRAVMLANAMA